LSIVMVSLALPQERGLRKVDFRNLTYAWDISPADDPPTTWRWIKSHSEITVRLVNGEHKFVDLLASEEGREHPPVLRFKSVTYGDLDGDGNEEAAVSLNYSTGGTLNWDYLYVYRLDHGKVKLLARLQSGSRADGGLIKAIIQAGLLILDFADTERRTADCCSDGYIRVHCRWNKGQFVDEGPQERGELKPNPH
jgi:hypothetical protein